jgi:putative spermidine/putrescine transport system substrate-binding protein
VHAKMIRRLGFAAVSGVVALSVAACGSSSDTTTADAPATSPATSAAADASTGASTGATGTTDWSTAQSADAGGGMDALVAAANAEGALNVIALPPTWANYGNILKAFQAKYPQIKVTSENPDGSSQDELTAIEKGKGQPTAPDVADVGLAYAFTGATAGDFAAYKVATWNDIPDAQKDAGGLWWADYGGYMSIGCNQTFLQKKGLTCPTTIKDLDNPAFKGMVALNGDPTQANAAFNAVWAASLANGGSADSIQQGIDFFKKLNSEGIFNKTSVTPATVLAGSTPIVMDWDYLQAANTPTLKKKGVTWVVNDPSDAVLGGYYSQAISATAPHPAAARLWEEFLYSHDAQGGQNLWLQGGARPAEFDAMKADGTLDAKAAAELPKVAGTSTFAPTQAQLTAAQKVIANSWADAVK